MIPDIAEEDSAWLKILGHIFPKRMQNAYKTFGEAKSFVSTALREWNDYPQYLQLDERKKYMKKARSMMSKIRSKWYLFSSKRSIYLESLNTVLNLFQTYKEDYIQHQKQKHTDFFSGREFNDSHVLNSEQIRAILINERVNLLVAGPGSGKTRVILDRVGFYHLKCGVPQDKILILAFNGSAAAEIRSRIHAKYGMDEIEIRTFHSLGMRILGGQYKSDGAEVHVESNSARVVRSVIDRKLKESKEFWLQYTSFFRNYISTQSVLNHGDLTEKQYKARKAQNYYALDGTEVKSLAEAEIANFFIRNGIDYIYELEVTWCDDDDANREYHPDFYLPNYDVYLEHWAFREGTRPPEWFNNPSNEYEKNRGWKRWQFKKHDKVLLDTYYEEWRDGILLDVLTEYCTRHNIECEPLTREEIKNKIGLGSDSTGMLSKMITSYIEAAKNCGYTAGKFKKRVLHEERQLNAYDWSFFQLVIPIFHDYNERLKEARKVDYNDMINLSVEFLRDGSINQGVAENLDYRMIFVDEFQDISSQRFELLRKLMDINPEATLFCVGDDWQAIYGFTGATNRYLTEYRRFFDDPDLSFLVLNYRNTDQILEYGSQIIQKTSDYLEKEFKPSRLKTDRKSFEMDIKKDLEITREREWEEQHDVTIHKISSSSERNFHSNQFDHVYDLINRLITEQHVDPSEIMVLSRFSFGLTGLKKMCHEKGDFALALTRRGDTVKSGVRFYTLHKSKGLEADIVIILNVYGGNYGLPSELEARVNYQFLNPDLAEEEDEEARLFFVGLTRARKQVYLYTWRENQSNFILPPDEFTEFKAAILNENDDAYLLWFVEREPKEKIWISKRAIKRMVQIADTKLRYITVDSTWLNNKFIEVEDRRAASDRSSRPWDSKTKNLRGNLESNIAYGEKRSQSRLKAAIVQKTKKAYLLYLVDIKDKPRIWIPKSAVLSKNRLGSSKLYIIRPKQWWVEENEDLLYS